MIFLTVLLLAAPPFALMAEEVPPVVSLRGSFNDFLTGQEEIVVTANTAGNDEERHHETEEIGAYSLVNIINSTPYRATGTVSYASTFCSDDDYKVESNKEWTASSRGVCLVTKIEAYLETPSGVIIADSYDSSGTSYSKFAVIPSSLTENYAVIRRATN